MADYIYVILDPLQFAIKVGFSNDPIKRLATLQTAHSRSELKLLNIFEGGLEEETLIHLELYKHRLKGEWFDFNQEVKDYLLDKQKSVYNDLKISPLSTDHFKVGEYCKEYLKSSITKKRTRVPLKSIRSYFTDLSLADIKSIMYDIGYVEWKDKAFNIHYYPD